MIYKFVAALILLIQSFNCFGQCAKPEKYPSREEEDYYRNDKYTDFKPADVSEIKQKTYDHVHLRSLDTENPYVSYWERTSYLKHFDSLEQICFTRLWKVIGTPEERHLNWDPVRYFNYEDSIEKLNLPKVEKTSINDQAEKEFNPCRDSVQKQIHHFTVDGINSDRIYRYDSLGHLKIVFYRDHELSENESDFYVAISINNGNTWNKCYTGLTENMFCYIKPNAKLPLIKNDSTIQLEIAFIRRVAEYIYGPFIPSESDYELVEDNLIMELNLIGLNQDSDKDGLTDLLEKRLLLNPLSKDTDHDGIDDAIDSNPRFKKTQNKFNNLYRSLLEGDVKAQKLERKDSLFIPFRPDIVKSIDKYSTKSTYSIVSDDPALLCLYNTRNRYIFFTNKEFEEQQKLHEPRLKCLEVSPLFKVDGKPGVWKISISGGFWGTEYLITEKPKGWIVKRIHGWIS